MRLLHPLIHTPLLIFFSYSASTEFAALREAALKLPQNAKITLAKDLMEDFLRYGDHQSSYRASLAINTLEQLEYSLKKLANPQDDSPFTPSRTPGKHQRGYGKYVDEEGNIQHVMVADLADLPQKQAIYIHSVLNLRFEDCSFDNKRINGGIFGFIEKCESNIKQLIKEYQSGRDFYLGRINSKSKNSKYCARARISNHAGKLKEVMPGRKADALQEDFLTGYPTYNQMLAQDLHPKDVDLIEAHLIHFFPWSAMQNSQRGTLGKKKVSAKVATKLTNLFNKMAAEVATKTHSLFKLAANKEVVDEDSFPLLISPATQEQEHNIDAKEIDGWSCPINFKPISEQHAPITRSKRYSRSTDRSIAPTAPPQKKRKRGGQ